MVPWEDATAGGFAVSRLIGEPERRRLEAELSGLWPPGPYALASAAAKVIDTMLGRSERVVTCFVAPDDATRGRTRTAALPVRLNRPAPMGWPRLGIYPADVPWRFRLKVSRPVRAARVRLGGAALMEEPPS